VKRRLLLGVSGALAGVIAGVLALWFLTRQAPATTPRQGGGRAERLRGERLPHGLDALKSVHRPKTAPGPHDWLAQHDEQGQTLKEYLAGDPVRVTDTLKALYLVRVGDFSAKEAKLMDLTREYLALHFQLTVHELAPVAASAIPELARRQNPLQGQLQWNSEWILTELLPKLRPADGVALMALTAVDLWPGPGWNFVFGQASISQQVGVWSFARHGDLHTEWRLALTRTLKVAAHEAGHMFSMHHCIAFECVMNGGNHLQETDQCPLEPSPVSLAKLAEATRADPTKRFAEERAFLQREGLEPEAAAVARGEAALAR
jgi:archaemetzincin